MARYRANCLPGPRETKRSNEKQRTWHLTFPTPQKKGSKLTVVWAPEKINKIMYTLHLQLLLSLFMNGRSNFELLHVLHEVSPHYAVGGGRVSNQNLKYSYLNSSGGMPA